MSVKGTIIRFASAAVAAEPGDGDRIRRFRVLPWDTVGRNWYGQWTYARGSVAIPDDVSRIKVLTDHRMSTDTLVGVTAELVDKEDALYAALRFAQTVEGDRILALIDDNVLDAVSMGVELTDPNGIGAVEVDGDMVYAVTAGAVLLEISVVVDPGFDDARAVESFAARYSLNASDAPVSEENNRKDITPVTTPVTPAVDAAAVDNSMTVETFTAALKSGLEAQGAQFAKGVADALAALAPQTTTEVTPVATVVEHSPYSFNGRGHSLVRDLWESKFGNGNADAAQRVRKFEGIVADRATFATGTTGNLAEIVPTTNRQDLYVGNLSYPRPLFDAFSHGVITDATPFRLPKFSSATGLAVTGTEGTNPADGSVDLTDQTITPTSVTGLFKMTREIAEGSNPALDQIVADEMQRAYEEEIETRLATLLTGLSAASLGATGSVSGDGQDLVQQLKLQLATAHFRRGGNRLNRLVAEQDAYVAAATATDTTGRPLLPYLASVNSDGSVAAGLAGLNLAGYPMTPAYALTAASYLFASGSAWTWNSPLQGFRFIERNGPALIELAIFGYNANAIIRSSDIVRVTFTNA